MGRRYRRKRNKGITSVVKDVVHISSQLPWWGALLAGLISYIFLAFVLVGYFEANITVSKDRSVFPIVEARLGKLIRISEWVGIACGLVGIFFSIRNYFFQNKATRTEKRIVTIISKILGRGLD